MASVILWMSPCGTHLKAVHSNSGETFIRCANPDCSNMYSLSGQIDSLFIEDENGNWQPVQPESQLMSVDLFERKAAISPGI